MRIATFLATAAALTASAALAQTTPQTTPPTTTAPQTGTMPDSTPPADTPQPSSAAPDATAAPAAGAAVIPTTATTLVQPAVGVDVLDAAGTKAGTIKELGAQFVTITTAKGDVRLAKTSIGPGPNGAVIGGTAGDLEAAAARATTPAAPARATRRAPRRR